jgi:hypothetical protein
MSTIIFYLLTGAGAGILAGLLGIGGGAIVVPALAWIFAQETIPTNAIMHVATSTSLAAMIFTTLVATITQQRKKAIQWHLVKQLAIGIIVGTISGVYLANYLSGHVLKLLFGVFMLVVASKLFIGKKATEKKLIDPNIYFQFLAGFFVGGLSGLLGIGGGVFMVPILLGFGLTTHQATGTSSICALLLSIIGTIGFIISGWHLHILPPGVSTGYIYWPAALSVAVASILFVPLGTKLAYTISTTALKRIFAIFLFLTGCGMVF